jgi:hypothetical protein
MDISRPDIRKRKLRYRFTLAVTGLILVVVVAWFTLRLKPAVPTVDSAVWTDTVKRGPLLRQVRGPGSLVPREDRIRLIPAETEATVVRIRVLPGAHVEPETVLMNLVDPELQQQLLDAQLQFQAAKADYKNAQARLQSDLMTQRASAATVGADQKQAQLQAQTDKNLYDLGVISGLTYSASRGKAAWVRRRSCVAKWGPVLRLSLSSRSYGVNSGPPGDGPNCLAFQFWCDITSVGVEHLRRIEPSRDGYITPFPFSGIALNIGRLINPTKTPARLPPTRPATPLRYQ